MRSSAILATEPNSLQERFIALQQVLLDLQAVWRPQPFKQRRLAWCDEYPRLAEALLALDDASYQQLFDDSDALHSFLAQYIEAFSGLKALTHLPEAARQTTRAEPHLDWGIPGRKWQQIERFAQAMGDMRGPLLEWCGGKGHLGRLLARRNKVTVTTLEVDAELCAQGEQLARRAGVTQVFHRVDVLSPHLSLLSGLHPVALHACGELHRRLVRKAVAEGSAGLDLAPCCYHLGSSEDYVPFSPEAELALSRDDLRLAVTATATASARETRLRDQEMAWKLGYIDLRNDLQGTDNYHNIKPINKAWLKLGFEGFCRKLAEREDLELPGRIDWDGYEAKAWQRQREVMRLSLVRHGIRRALELWLVLDMALFLQGHGYTIKLSEFCDPGLTPRNILLSAHRP